MIRKIVYILVGILLAYFVFTNLDEVWLIIGKIGRANGFWLLAAILVQIIWLITIAYNARACLRVVGVDETISHLVPLTAAANFVNIIAPSYGVGALAVFVFDGHQRGKPPARVSTAGYLYIVYDYAAVVFMLIPTLLILSNRDVLDTLIIGGAIFVLTVGLILFSLTFLGIRSVEHMSRASMGFIDMVNRALFPIIKRNLIKKEWAHGFLTDLSEGLTHVHRTPRDVILPFVLALLRQFLMMLILFLVSLAFDHPFDLGTLIASYGVSMIFAIASITPSGVGFVEGAMGLIQNALGVDPLASAAIAIMYRGITFWLILLYGVFAIRWVGYTIENTRQNKHTDAYSTKPDASPEAALCDPESDLQLETTTSHREVEHELGPKSF